MSSDFVNFFKVSNNKLPDSSSKIVAVVNFTLTEFLISSTNFPYSSAICGRSDKWLRSVKTFKKDFKGVVNPGKIVEINSNFCFSE